MMNSICKTVKGHEVSDIARFLKKTRHMIIFDVISDNCSVGYMNERIRLFLTAEGYQNALEAERNGDFRIIHHAKVRNGTLLIAFEEQEQQ